MTSTPIQKLLMLSGVYCIPSHYEYEKGRGVDQISAMRVACSPFIEASPAYRLKCIVRSDGSEECKLLDAGGSRLTLDDHVLPDLLFIHGVDDNVVQYTQSCEMVDSIRSTLKTPERCRELILEGVGHVDTALHLMVGGVTKDIIKVEIMGDDGGNK